MFLFQAPILPNGFKFPTSYLDYINQNVDREVYPWQFMCRSKALSLSYYGLMLERFAEREFVPFAAVNDQAALDLYNDGWICISCFDGEDSSDDPSIILFDFQKRDLSWQQRPKYRTFSDWLEFASKESRVFHQLNGSE